MKYYGPYPRDNGSTDFCDSARLAGLLAVFGELQLMPRYFDSFDNPIRCPWSGIRGDKCANPITMTRDQLIPLIAGYKISGDILSVADIFCLLKERHWICPSGDILTPSQRDHFKICAGYPPTNLGRFWLNLDILWSAFVDPMAEPNQLICMLMIAGPKYVRRWTFLNRKWRESLRIYWGGWRNEKELAEIIIKKLEGIK